MPMRAWVPVGSTTAPPSTPRPTCGIGPANSSASATFRRIGTPGPAVECQAGQSKCRTSVADRARVWPSSTAWEPAPRPSSRREKRSLLLPRGRAGMDDCHARRARSRGGTPRPAAHHVHTRERLDNVLRRLLCAPWQVACMFPVQRALTHGA